MGKVAERAVEEVLEIGLKVVGCQYKSWNHEDFIENFQTTNSITFKPEPTNPHDPNALLVLYKGEPCGYVAKECIEYVNKFRRAYEIVRPHLTDYSTVADVDIFTFKNGSVKMFDLHILCSVWVPTEVSEVLDNL